MELAYLSAAEALAAFRSREISPVELMQAVIDRANAVEPQINAFSETHFEAALDLARIAEERYTSGAEVGPLEGLPVAVKAETEVAGQNTSQSSLVFDDYRAEGSEPVAERIIGAGGIVHARTSMPEFAVAPFTHSRRFGVSRNPWNLEFSPGGSSGGAGSSLAAGTTTLANGSDIGGSLRTPASSCGVVGYKPPYGRVPVMPPLNLDHYCHNGPMARNVPDCALLQNVIAGPHRVDVATVPAGPPLNADRADLREVKIAMSIGLGGYEVDPEVSANLVKTAGALEELGARVTEVDPAWDLDELVHAATVHYGTIFRSLVESFPDLNDEFSAYTSYFAEYAGGIADQSSYSRALTAESAMHTALGEIFLRHDILVCPTLAFPAFIAGDDYVEAAPEVNGHQLSHFVEALMTVPFNVCSRSPVLSVPSGSSSAGVPTGMQIVGRPFDEQAVFDVAAAYEAANPWDKPDGRPSLDEV